MTEITRGNRTAGTKNLKSSVSSQLIGRWFLFDWLRAAIAVGFIAFVKVMIQTEESTSGA
jgi:hypothetical protein